MDELAPRIEVALREQDYERQRQLAFDIALAGGAAVWPWVERLTTAGSADERILGFMLAREMGTEDDDDERAWARKFGIATADVVGFDAEQLAALGNLTGRTIATTDDVDVLDVAIFAASGQNLTVALPAILGHLDHPDEDIRFAVAYSAGSIEPGEHADAVVAALVTLARDPEDDVRDYALFGLGRPWDGPIDTPETRAVFRENVGHAHGGVQYEAMVALALLGDVDQMIEALEEEHVGPELVEKAAEMGDPRLHAGLIDLRDSGWVTSEWCEELMTKALAATSA